VPGEGGTAYLVEETGIELCEGEHVLDGPLDPARSVLKADFFRLLEQTGG
jgi:hypothetical protein